MMPSLGGFPSEYRHPVWYGKTRMVTILIFLYQTGRRWCGYPKVKKFRRYLYSFFDRMYTNVTDTRTDVQTPHDGTDRACIASRAKNKLK